MEFQSGLLDWPEALFFAPVFFLSSAVSLSLYSNRYVKAFDSHFLTNI